MNSETPSVGTLLPDLLQPKINPELWARCLHPLVLSLNVEGIFIFTERGGNFKSFVSAAYSKHAAANLNRQWTPANVRLARFVSAVGRKKPDGKLFLETALIASRELERPPNKSRSQKHQNSLSLSGACLFKANGGSAIIVFVGGPPSIRPNDDFTRFGEQIVSYLIGATQTTVAAMHQMANTIGQTFNECAVPLVLLGENGHVVATNKLAMAAMKNCLSIQNGLLAHEAPQVDRKLKNLLQNVAEQDIDQNLLIVPRPLGEPLVIKAARLPGIALEPFARGSVALMIQKPVPPTYDTHTLILREQYRLSPAELRVALKVLSGLSPLEISEHLGVTIQTIRNQMVSIFNKTKVNRQSEFVAKFNIKSI